MIIKALLATRQGHLAEALTWVDRASPVAELIPYRQGSAGYVKAEILLLTGQLIECADWCQRIEPTATARGHSFALLRLWHIRAQLFHDAGDHAGACALYDQILQLTNQMGIAEPCAVPWARHALISYLIFRQAMAWFGVLARSSRSKNAEIRAPRTCLEGAM